MRCASVLAVLVFLLAGCGGGSPEGDVDPKPPATHAELVAKGDRVCKRTNDQLNAINRSLSREIKAAGDDAPEALRRSAPLFQRAYDLQRQAVAELKELDVPPAERGTWGTILDDAQQQVTLLGQFATAARERDEQRFASVRDQLNGVNARVAKQLRDFGFHECGSGGA